jgi:hypothetical protein
LAVPSSTTPASNPTMRTPAQTTLAAPIPASDLRHPRGAHRRIVAVPMRCQR